jgi:hypothetical protein
MIVVKWGQKADQPANEFGSTKERKKKKKRKKASHLI